MVPAEFTQLVSDRYEAQRNPNKATGMAAYMKNQFPFLGIQTPEREKINRTLLPIIKTIVDETWLVETALALWAKDQREYQYCALNLLIKYQVDLSASAMPTIEYLITHKSWWDTVDAIASRIVGKLVRRYPELLIAIERYSTDTNLWLRRTAILYQLGYKTQTDGERLFRYCSLNANSREFFIQKAIGWALREYSKTDDKAVIAYIRANSSKLSNLSKREGLKRTSVSWHTL